MKFIHELKKQFITSGSFKNLTTLHNHFSPSSSPLPTFNLTEILGKVLELWGGGKIEYLETLI